MPDWIAIAVKDVPTFLAGFWTAERACAIETPPALAAVDETATLGSTNFMGSLSSARNQIFSCA
jgi:hypothetical protein